MDWKGNDFCIKKDCSCIRSMELRITGENFIQENRSPNLESNPGLAEYCAEAIDSQHLVKRPRDRWRIRHLSVAYLSQYHFLFSTFNVPLHVSLHPLAEDADVTNGTEVVRDSNTVLLK